MPKFFTQLRGLPDTPAPMPAPAPGALVNADEHARHAAPRADFGAAPGGPSFRQSYFQPSPAGPDERRGPSSSMRQNSGPQPDTGFPGR